MIKIKRICFLILLGSLLFGTNCAWSSEQAFMGVIVSGQVSNISGKALEGAQLSFSLNGNKLKGEHVTSNTGTFNAELELPARALAPGELVLEVEHPGYKNSAPIKLEPVQAGPGKAYLANVSLELERATTPSFWLATFILVLAYVIIAFEWLHRTLAAMSCAAAVLFVSYTAGTFNPDYFILSFEGAAKAIDLNVIFLLMGMMIIVGVLKRTGVFQWLAYKSYELAKGDIYILTIILMVVTAICSAFLDNVTTMLLTIPVTIEIAVALRINPVALLMPEVFASNVGGTATLIGDPPNIMIGSYANLAFMDFVVNLGLICSICLIFTVVYFLFWYRSEYRKAHMSLEEVRKLTEQLRDECRITDAKLLVQSGVVLLTTIGLFISHGVLHMEPSIAAMSGAAVLLMISRVHIVKMLENEVEWPTLIFFMMLFIVVAGAEETGLIQIIADWVNHMSQGSVVTAALIILWVSAIASAIVDNIPFTATMLPLVGFLTTSIPGAESGVLWWALALGACMGGNGSMIGASANVLTVGMAEKAGYPISFMYYLKVVLIPTLITVSLCMGWILLVMV